MKPFLFSLTLLLSFNLFAENGVGLLYHWKDVTLPSSFAHDNTYNEIWGYSSDGREYAIIGSTMGTHIFDITDLGKVDTTWFIQGKVTGSQIVHRDYDTYKDYLYIVADEGNSSLQIADLSSLPDSAPVIYDSNNLITRSHNIFIDTAKGWMYVCGGHANGAQNSLSIYSLEPDPTNPTLVIDCDSDIPTWVSTVGYVHDIYVKNDTAYCNAEGRGLFVVDFGDTSNVQVIGSFTNYPHKGYNHSGWLHPSGEFYVFADETHGTLLKVVDVTDLSNITLIDTFGVKNSPYSIPHNLIFLGDILYVSYYFDGVYAFDLSDPQNISVVGFYDTSFRPHRAGKYEGCWGVYPFLPSGHILSSDMQEGLYVLTMGLTSAFQETDQKDLFLYPNPAVDKVFLGDSRNLEGEEYAVMDSRGRELLRGNLQGRQALDISSLSPGIYYFSIRGENPKVKRFVKN